MQMLVRDNRTGQAVIVRNQQEANHIAWELRKQGTAGGIYSQAGQKQGQQQWRLAQKF